MTLISLGIYRKSEKNVGKGKENVNKRISTVRASGLRKEQEIVKKEGLQRVGNLMKSLFGGLE